MHTMYMIIGGVIAIAALATPAAAQQYVLVIKKAILVEIRDGGGRLVNRDEDISIDGEQTASRADCIRARDIVAGFRESVESKAEADATAAMKAVLDASRETQNYVPSVSVDISFDCMLRTSALAMGWKPTE